MSHIPFFSIIIPTYNRAHIIKSTLDSVRNQTFVNYELIIVDDGSTDKTKDIVTEYINYHQLTNWHYHFKINGERGAARNFGVNKSKGTFITFLDSDDILYKNHLATANGFILNNQKAKIFHSAYEFKKNNSSTIRGIKYPSKNLNNAILNGNIMSCFGVFIKRDLALIYSFDENRELSGSEDWLLWLRLITKNTICFQPIVTGCMIEHDERSVLNFSPIQLEKRAEILHEKLLGDSDFLAEFGSNQVNKIYAHMLTYGALHLVLCGKKTLGIQLFAKALKYDIRELFKIRTLGIFKNILKK